MWWQYDQNNSGGSYEGPACLVFVEATDAASADAIAQQHGIYFDGCDRGIDCACCGDRWDHADEAYWTLRHEMTQTSIYLVPANGHGALVRRTDGTWAPEHEELVDRVRFEIAAQVAEATDD